MTPDKQELDRRAALHAMGIDVWLARDETAPALASGESAEAPTSGEPANSAVRQMWKRLHGEVTRCTKCRLHETRTQSVFGGGDPSSHILIVGEAPGVQEDRLGEPFVAEAGVLLTAMLSAIGLNRDQVFITNALKCRPPQNRDPRRDERDACAPYLQRQIDAIAPRAILAVGRMAAQQLLGSEESLGRLRGRKHVLEGSECPVVVTYHPGYLIRTPAQKARSWDDLKLFKQVLAERA